VASPELWNLRSRRSAFQSQRQRKYHDGPTNSSAPNSWPGCRILRFGLEASSKYRRAGRRLWSPPRLTPPSRCLGNGTLIARPTGTTSTQPGPVGEDILITMSTDRRPRSSQAGAAPVGVIAHEPPVSTLVGQRLTRLDESATWEQTLPPHTIPQTGTDDIDPLLLIWMKIEVFLEEGDGE
jgi:hypothetical protein